MLLFLICYFAQSLNYSAFHQPVSNAVLYAPHALQILGKKVKIDSTLKAFQKPLLVGLKLNASLEKNILR
jgi:hypothetical protein